ncbi:MAG: DUF5668 domain-containing protein [Peptostreptococcaceae bacterium]|jgi:hypothetical protein|nr:DUF5668 domain-containing protein [Peptostreptococcaceae bacterium]
MKSSKIITGIFLICLGIFFLMDKLNIININLNILWPCILMLVGVRIILKNKDKQKKI